MIDIQQLADDLAAKIRAAVLASDLGTRDLVTVTTDGRQVQTALSLAAGAIVVYTNPAIEWPAPRITSLEWTIAVLSSDSTVRAHALISLLRDGNLLRFGDKATPTDFQMPDQSTIPGYTITHTEEHQ